MRKCKNQESFMDKKEPSHCKSATAVISTKYKNKPEFITLVIYRLLLLEDQTFYGTICSFSCYSLFCFVTGDLITNEHLFGNGQFTFETRIVFLFLAIPVTVFSFFK